jgi:8-oxo-dGTP diphosphatase
MAWTATNSEGYEAPAALAVDVVVLTVRDGALVALTVPSADGSGRAALPGGFVGRRESPEAAARRKLREKTGLYELYLEQLAAFADPDRDPRGWIPSIAHLALVPPDTQPTDAAAHWIGARSRRALAYDHRKILKTAIARVEGKLWWSNVAVGILPGAFSMTQARGVYEAISGATYDAATFARDLKATGLVEPTGERRSDGPGRPAALYRFCSHRQAWGAGHRKRVG